MRQWIKLACFVAAASLLVGLLVYGGVTAMYRLADALSLSPALKNLVPLVAIGVLWFIASRSMKYFQRRAEHRSVTSDKDEERRQAWLQIKSKGQKALRMADRGHGLGIVGVCNLHTRYAHIRPENAPTLQDRDRRNHDI